MKAGRNDPCPCGSGEKYKKRCLTKDSLPIPQEVIDYFTKVRAKQEFYKRAGIHINYVNPVDFKGKRVWALGSTVYPNFPKNTTFHEFLIEILKNTLGYNWLREQAVLSADERHFISICLEKLGEWIERNEKTAQRIEGGGGAWGATPDGYSKTLLLLAFDVCSLIHTHKLPDQLLRRLKSRDHYQGARYEVAIAAIFARLDCDIQFTDENSKNKHCEFIATHRETGASLAVEAKSKHRFGVLHQFGFLPPLQKLLSGRTIRRLLNDALEQNPKDIPFAVFFDVNSPPTPQIPFNDKPWVKDAKSLVAKKLKELPPEEYPLSAAFFTNFSYHYQTESEAQPGEVLSLIVPHPKFPPPNERFFSYLQGALSHYGFVPAIGIDDPAKPT